MSWKHYSKRGRKLRPAFQRFRRAMRNTQLKRRTKELFQLRALKAQRAEEL